MKILWQALRAVSIELLGVVLVLWLLFSSITWTLQSAGMGPEPASSPGLLSSLASYFEPESNVAGGAEIASDADASESASVERKLDYYSRLYRRAARALLKQMAEDFSGDDSRSVVEPSNRTRHELLGTL